jgi:hypothetical protein
MLLVKREPTHESESKGDSSQRLPSAPLLMILPSSEMKRLQTEES